MKKQRSETNLCREHSRERKKKLTRQESNQSLKSHKQIYEDQTSNPRNHKVCSKRNLQTKERMRNMAMVKEKAQALLSKEDFSTLTFYLSEYKHGNIGIRDLVRTLKKMFECEEKESLFTEIREVVHKKDLAEFDRIIYEKGKLYERVIQSMVQLNHSESTRSLQVKKEPSERKFVRNKSLEKLRNLHYSLSSDNVLLSRQLGGSQPILSNRQNFPISRVRNSCLPRNSPDGARYSSGKCGSRNTDNGQHRFRESQNAINEANSSNSTCSYKKSSSNLNGRSYNTSSHHSFKDTSKSCELLLGSRSSFHTLSCDELDNTDIEQEEKFLNEEMKTEWIPKPTRSISLAMFQSPHVSTKIY